MTSGEPRLSADEARAATVLAATGAWTVVVPYLAKALGLDVDVPDAVEIVDHVVPGAAVTAAGLYLRAIARRGPWPASPSAPFAAGLCLLAGFWVLATHVPLLGDAAEDRVGWDAAVWHSISALPIVALALWCVLRAVPAR
jgi:hypothetical protein